MENRAEGAFSDLPQTTRYRLDGHSARLDGKSTLSGSLQNTLLQKLPTYAHSLKDGTMNWKQMLGNSSFVLPLDATGSGSAYYERTVWGGGAYNELTGKRDGLNWGGKVFSLQLGIDERVRDTLLVGGFASWSEGDVDYTLDGKSGDYKYKMSSVHPYLIWSDGRVNLWGSAGYGWGTLKIKEDDVEGSTNTGLLSLAAGIGGPLSQASNVRIKGDVSLIQTNINGSDSIAEQRVANQQLRLLLETKGEHRLASGSVKSMLEIGLRYDGGDGKTGYGVELGSSLGYTNPFSCLSLSGKVRTLLGQDDYNEWGVQGMIRLEPGISEHGLSFRLSPSYGNTNSRMSEIWRQGLVGDNGDNSDESIDSDYSAQLEGYLGYGFSAPGGRGLLLPYGEMTLGDRNRYALGLHWKPNAQFNLKVVGEHREDSEGTANHAILLESQMRF